MYLKIVDGSPVKYSVDQLRIDNQHVSFPRQIDDYLLESYSVYPYTRSTPPTYDYLSQRLIDGEFEQSDGNWVLPYLVENLEQDNAEKNIKAKRDGLLNSTDWLVIKYTEMGESLPQEWSAYRQALRDVTSQSGFPYDVEWPTKPT